MHKSLSCETCDYTGKSTNDLKKHSVRHSVNKSTCKDCGKIFSTTKGLTLHIKIHQKSDPETGPKVEAEERINKTLTSKRSKKSSSNDVNSSDPLKKSVNFEKKKEDSIKKKQKKYPVKTKLDNVGEDGSKKLVLNLSIDKNEEKVSEIKDLDLDNKSNNKKVADLQKPSSSSVSETSKRKRKREKFITRQSPKLKKSKIPIERKLKEYKIKCHCVKCIPCKLPCCENPAVRAGKCCDPSTLGGCLQPYEPECYAPCCNATSGGVKLEGHYKFINKKLEYRKPFQFVNPFSFYREFAEDALYSRMKNEFVKSKEYCDPISLFNDGSPESFDYFTEPPLNALVYEDEFSLNDASDNENDLENVTNEEFFEDMRNDQHYVDPCPCSKLEVIQQSLPPGVKIVHTLVNNNWEVVYKYANGEEVYPARIHEISKLAGSPMKDIFSNPITIRRSSNIVNVQNIKDDPSFKEEPRNKDELRKILFEEVGGNLTSIGNEYFETETNTIKNEQNIKDDSSFKEEPRNKDELRKILYEEVGGNLTTFGNEYFETATTKPLDPIKIEETLEEAFLPFSPNMNNNASNEVQKIEGTKVDEDKNSNFSQLKTEKISDADGSIDTLDNKSKDPGERKLDPDPKKLEASTKTGYCWPCKVEFPVNDMNKHLLEKHKDDKTKPRSCKICNNYQLMTNHYMNQHRKREHSAQNQSLTKKGRPRKEQSTNDSLMLNDSLIAKPHPFSGDSFVKDEFFDVNESMNEGELNISAPLPDAAIHDQIQTKKRGRPKKDESRPRSKSVGGELMNLKPSKSRKQSSSRKTKKLSDNDPAHPTSSVNLRQQGRHVHDGDTSLDCSTCSLSPKGPMTIQKEYSVPSQIVEIGQKNGVTGDRDKVIQISSPS